MTAFEQLLTMRLLSQGLHAEVTWLGGNSVSVTDVGSRNGSWIKPEGATVWKKLAVNEPWYVEVSVTLTEKYCFNRCFAGRGPAALWQG